MTYPSILMVRGGDLNWSPHIVTLANYLSRQGFAITLATYGTDKQPEPLASDIELVQLDDSIGIQDRDLRYRVTVAAKIRNLAKQTRFDLIYVIDSWTLPYLWLATNGQFVQRPQKLVYHTFEWLEPGFISKFRIWFERVCCQRADLIVNAERTRARLSQTLYKLDKTPLWIRNSLNRDVVISPQDPKLRARLVGQNAPSDTVLMVYPSVASAERLTLELIEAFALLPARYRLVTLYQEGDYYRRCLKSICERKLADRVQMLPAAPHPQIMGYLACADIGAIFHDASTSGNFMCAPQRVSEYTANGIPFVASDYPNMEALVYRYNLGVCCNPFIPRQIADAIRELSEGSTPLKERRIHVRRVFEDELCFEVHGERLATALASLCNGASAISTN